MSTRWLYKVVDVTQWMGVKPKKIEELIAPLGQLGWELVAVTWAVLVRFSSVPGVRFVGTAIVRAAVNVWPDWMPTSTALRWMRS